MFREEVEDSYSISEVAGAVCRSERKGAFAEEHGDKAFGDATAEDGQCSRWGGTAEAEAADAAEAHWTSQRPTATEPPVACHQDKWKDGLWKLPTGISAERDSWVFEAGWQTSDNIQSTLYYALMMWISRLYNNEFVQIIISALLYKEHSVFWS